MSEQNGFKGLEVVELNISKGEYLSEALKRQGYPMLPSNAIINKVMTGTGATYMELNAKLSPRNSIVIEPFKSSVENKVLTFNEAQGVFKEVTVKKLIAYLKNPNIKYKKIITTPEGFQSKVLKVAKDLGLNIYIRPNEGVLQIRGKGCRVCHSVKAEQVHLNTVLASPIQVGRN